MQNFVYHNPTKVLFGRGTIPQIGPETSILGSRVLLLSGRSSAKTGGVYQVVYNSLVEAGCTVFEFPGITPNPTLEQVRLAIEFGVKNSVDVICGVGGGSVIDSAKAVSAGVVVKHDVWKFFTGKKSIKNTLPVTTVSTLAGSGSENNSGMVLTNSAQGVKFGFAHRFLYPKVSILDPEATFSVPEEYIAYGAIDAITHLLEFYFSHNEKQADVQDNYIEGLVRSIAVNCTGSLSNPLDYNSRANLMWSAALALNGLSSAGLGKLSFSMHLIEHSLSAAFDTPHGAGLAVIVPAWLRHHRECYANRINRLFDRAFSDTLGCSEEDSVEEKIAQLENWFIAIGAPTRLAGLGIREQEIDALAQNSRQLARIWRMREFDEQTVARILQLAI